jgi:hypothetical protein
MNSSDLSVRVKPRIMPRSIGDFCMGFFVVFPVQMFVLFILPGLVGYLVSHSELMALLPPVIVYLLFLAFSVWSITLTPEGIRFHRLIGVPKFLPWSSISSVEIASQRELITKGWLWPLFPAREMTPSLSSVRHYRISWREGFCYYPPAEAAAFEAHVRRYLERPSA